MFRSPRSERGQVIVIVALALTAFVAMVGVVVDGGIALSNRRQVQNAADSAALAGTRVLGLDLKWRATGADPSDRPFVNADAAVCDAINNALGYNTNGGQVIGDIDCVTGSDEATYVRFVAGQVVPYSPVRQVGNGIPGDAQGVRVVPTGQTETLLMNVVGIASIPITADATALAGPGAPPLGALMPFVVQNPLGPFLPGKQYEIRSESEGECSASVQPDTNLADLGFSDDIVFASFKGDGHGHNEVTLGAPTKPAVPEAVPGDDTTFTVSVTVTLTAGENGTKIYYTTDSTSPVDSPTRQEYTGPLTFTSTTRLDAIVQKGQATSDIGTFIYTQVEPPEPVTADPGDGTVFTTSQAVTLDTATDTAEIRYTTDGTNPTATSQLYVGALTFTDTTQVRALAEEDGVVSAIRIFNYVKDGDVVPPVADPPGGEFESTETVELSSATAGATIYYTLDGSEPTDASIEYTGVFNLTASAVVKAYATFDGNDSLAVEWVFTRTTPSCPDLSAGNFGYVDFSGGSGNANEIKEWIEDPSTAPVDWYYTPCSPVKTVNCRDEHDPDDLSDDHWLLEGTTGHKDIAMRDACELYLGQEIYVPIWDGPPEIISKKPNGSNAIFHLIGFGVFQLDGIIDNAGPASGDPCDGVDLGGPPNDKGFIATYISSFVGTQVVPCIPSQDGSNPCTALQQQALTINLAQ